MSNSEIRTGVFPGRLIDTLNGRQISSSSFPFNKNGYDPFRLLAVGDDVTADSEIKGRLRKPHYTHFRNHEVILGHCPGVIWEDEFGNLFSQLQSKGSDARNVRLVRTPGSDLNYMAWGLTNTLGLERQVMVSTMMREAGVDTEMIELLFYPDALPVDGQVLSTLRKGSALSDFEKALLGKALNNGREEVKTDLRGVIEANASDLAGALYYLNQVDHVVEFRSLSVPYSLSDLVNCSSKEEFLEKAGRVITITNHLEAIRARRDENHSQDQFDPSKASDIKRYFTSYLPRNLAINLAKTHNLGLVHWATGLGNILANGGIKDLEYVFGLPGELTPGDGVSSDWSTAKSTLEHFIWCMVRKGWILDEESKDDYKEDSDGILEKMAIARRYEEMASITLFSVYHTMRTPKHGSYEYSWVHDFRMMEFFLYKDVYFGNAYDLSERKEQLVDDVLNLFSKVYGWDYRVDNPSQQPDTEEIFEAYLEQRRNAIKEIPQALPQLHYLDDPKATPQQQLLIYAYRDTIGDSTAGVFYWHLHDVLEEAVLQAIRKQADKFSYFDWGGTSEFQKNLAYYYALRERDRYYTMLEQQGLIDLLVQEVEAMEAKEIAQLLEQQRDSS